MPMIDARPLPARCADGARGLELEKPLQSFEPCLNCPVQGMLIGRTRGSYVGCRDLQEMLPIIEKRPWRVYLRKPRVRATRVQDQQGADSEHDA
jgi:hypothetical protein